MREKQILGGNYVNHDSQEAVTSTKVVNKKISNIMAIGFLVASITGGVLFYNTPSQVIDRENQKKIEEIKTEYIVQLGEEENFETQEFKNAIDQRKVFIVMKEMECTEEEAVEMLIKSHAFETDPKLDTPEETYVKIRKEVLGY